MCDLKGSILFLNPWVIHFLHTHLLKENSYFPQSSAMSALEKNPDFYAYVDLFLNSIFCCTGSSICFLTNTALLNCFSPRLIQYLGDNFSHMVLLFECLVYSWSFALSYAFWNQLAKFLQSPGEFWLELYWIHKVMYLHMYGHIYLITFCCQIDHLCSIMLH